MKVLVTGGAGFIGARLVQALCNAGHQVRMLSRKPPQTLPGGDASIELLQCDLLDASYDLEQLVDGCAVVFNCAGELHDQALMEALHVDATRRLVQACKAVAKTSGQQVHWVQLSSVGAYGPVTHKPNTPRIVTEETVTAPANQYELTKTRADELISAAAEQGVFSYTLLRPSNVYGPGMPNNAIRQWARLIKKRLFFYVGSADAVATYVHVDDVVSCLLICGFDPRARGEVFNLSNDCAQTELVTAMARALKVAPPSVRLPESVVRRVAFLFSGIKSFPVKPSRIDALVARTYYPTHKLKRVLDYQPEKPVGNTIADVLDERL